MSPLAFSPGMDINYLFERIRALRHTAVQRRPQTIPTVKQYICDAILIVEGLKDQPRARKLHYIKTAVEMEDMYAISKAVGTLFEHFQMIDAYNLPLLPARQYSYLISIHADARPIRSNGQERSLFFKDRALAFRDSHVILDKAALETPAFRGRSPEREGVSIPRVQERSSSPVRRLRTRVVSSYRCWDEH